MEKLESCQDIMTGEEAIWVIAATAVLLESKELNSDRHLPVKRKHHHDTAYFQLQHRFILKVEVSPIKCHNCGMVGRRLLVQSRV